MTEKQLDQLFRESLNNDYDEFEKSLEGINVTVLKNLQFFLTDRFWYLAKIKDVLISKLGSFNTEDEKREAEETIEHTYLVLALLEKKLLILNGKIKSLAIEN